MNSSSVPDKRGVSDQKLKKAGHLTRQNKWETGDVGRPTSSDPPKLHVDTLPGTLNRGITILPWIGCLSIEELPQYFVTFTQRFTCTHFYTWIERNSLNWSRVSCVRKQHEALTTLALQSRRLSNINEMSM